MESGSSYTLLIRGQEQWEWPLGPWHSQGTVWNRAGSPPAHGPQHGTAEPLAVLGLQDVRYLHFLEGTRDYEWLEAMFLNQTMAKTKLHWFRYLFPS